MREMKKPKLVFFQWQNVGLSKFILSHREQHAKCLSEFFDVTVISEDCDYQKICDKYQPDIALFESGVNYSLCRKLEITNTHVHPQIPKIGLHNGDSWCEARAGFLCDMDHWGIETFFSICVTAAEYMPEASDNLFIWPNFIDADIYRDYGESKIVPVLFTGYIHSLYPWRQQIYDTVSQNYPSLICPHLGYEQQKTSRMLTGEQYARTINASWFVPTCGTVAKELVRKHLEIPASRACLITEKTPVLEAAGFADMQNCIFADRTDILDKLDYLFEKPEKLKAIVDAGYQLVHLKHTLKQRSQILDWFNLYQNLEPNQKVVQSDPFKALTVIEKASKRSNSHITGDGLIAELLKQGDKKLWAGQHDEAESLYLRCSNFISWFANPKLRLALCKLYQGNAGTALWWILQPIQYTLETYKSLEPDPVEWAYLIITLLCQGQLEMATKCADLFPLLSHPELERTRWIVGILNNKSDRIPTSTIYSKKHRYSIHQLPERSLDEWIEQLCFMLKACKQTRFAKTVKRARLAENEVFDQRGSQDRADDSIKATSQQSASEVKEALALILQLQSESKSINLAQWIKANLRKAIKYILHDFFQVSISYASDGTKKSLLISR